MTEEEKEKTIEIIEETLRQGMMQKDAATWAGISETTFYEWAKDRSFRSRVESATLAYKRELIERVRLGAKADPRLALEVLSRRWPDEWSGKLNVEVTSPEDKIKRVMDLIEGVHDKQMEHPFGDGGAKNGENISNDSANN
jgi:hypothetical protein